MNFDPLEYLMQDHQNRLVLDRQRDQELHTVRARMGNHERRLNSLESWRQSVQKQIRRWPFVVVPVVIVLANIAPQETLKTVVEILKALV